MALELAGRLRAGALHAGARARAAAGLRAALGGAGAGGGGVILLQGGACACRNETDHEELFRQESYFHYLFGVAEGGCFGSVDVASGRSTLFVPQLPEEYAVWMGEVPSLGARDAPLPPPRSPCLHLRSCQSGIFGGTCPARACARAGPLAHAPTASWCRRTDRLPSSLSLSPPPPRIAAHVHLIRELPQEVRRG